MRLLPILPAGWLVAYSSFVKFLAPISAIATVSPKTIWIAVEVTGAKSKGHSSRSRGKCTFISQTPPSTLPSTEVTAMRNAPLALAQGTRRRSSSVLPDLLNITRTSPEFKMPISPWSASRGERNAERMPRETRVCEILRATKPDLPTPEKKMVPGELRRVAVNLSVWERSRFWKKKLRWFCWDLKRLRSVDSLIEVWFGDFSGKSEEEREMSEDEGRDPIRGRDWEIKWEKKKQKMGIA